MSSNDLAKFQNLTTIIEPDHTNTSSSDETSEPCTVKPSDPAKPSDLPAFKPFTKRSLERVDTATLQIARDCGYEPKKRKLLSAEEGAQLPDKYEPFPPELYGRPLEEIDHFIFDETFCVVSKRFQKNYVHRFTATKSLFLFSPWHPARRASIFLSTNQYFDYVVMATILLNCVFLAMTETIEEAEYVFLAIYTCEMIIKSIAKGFILTKFTYLRNPWNWLDFIVITSGYVTIAMDIGNLAGLRTFRVLRALKTVSIMPGLKTIINALLHSFKQLAEVMTLTIFCLMVFALFALQVYKGELRNKCVYNIYDRNNASHFDWVSWTINESNWLMNDEDEPVICGNVTGSRHCPANFTCLCVGPNPNFGYTNFDNFFWSMLTTFQLITLDYWENVYNMVLSACGPLSVPFFTIVVFFGSFYLINLMLAVVALSYEEEAELTLEERRKELMDHREDSTFSFDPSNLNVKELSKTKQKKVDSRKGYLLASYSRKRTRRRKRNNTIIQKDSSNNNSCKSNNKTVPRKSDAASPRNSITPTPTPSISPQHVNEAQKENENEAKQVLPFVQTDDATDEQELEQPEQNQVPLNLDNKQLRIVDNRDNKMLTPHRYQLQSRQASSTASDGGNNMSSFDDSGVVEDHEDNTEAGSDNLNIKKLDLANTKYSRVSKREPREIPIRCNPMESFEDKDELPDRNCSNCSKFCINYQGWLRFQQCLYKIVRDPIFELVITLCIVLNTMILALEHHGMSPSIGKMLDVGNKVFTTIFTFECVLKVMALSKEFFRCGWNIFDLLIVSASLLDLIFELVDGLSVLRGLRLLRVLKLAQSWITMKVLLSIIISTIGALGNLTFVLCIVIYIFAVIGMQLFSKDYTPEKFDPDPVPRWNFNDFFHSFMMIFRILCGEWIEPLWDCMRTQKENGPGTCFLVFLPALVMGNFMVLNLFLALLLNSFNSEELKARKDEVGDESRLAQSFQRIREIVRRRRQNEAESEKGYRLTNVVKEMMERHRSSEGLTQVQKPEIIFRDDLEPRDTLYRRSYQEAIINRPISGSDFNYGPNGDTARLNGSKTTSPDRVIYVTDVCDERQSFLNLRNEKDELNVENIEMRTLNRGTSTDTDQAISLTFPVNTSDDKSLSIKQNPMDVSKEEKPEQTQAEPQVKKHNGAQLPQVHPWLTLVSYVDELTVGGRRNSKGHYIDGMGNFPLGFGRQKKPKVPMDCFPAKCYEEFLCFDKCIQTELGQKWMEIRTSVLSVVDTPSFEWFILVLIFASSITLCFEDIYLDNNPELKRCLYWTNFTFSIIFVVEMVLKWLALGFNKYFTSFWTILDFIIVFVSIFSLLIEENENLKVLRSLRTLRALRPLRAISRWQGMRIVVNALMYAIPSIFNVLLVCLVFWLIFSIMGVQFFGGKFFKCIDDYGEMLPVTVVNDKWMCIEKNYTWINSKITFDHVGAAYLALFQVATFEGWMEVMADAVDGRGVNLQPQREANLYAYIYFVIFIVCGSFFTLNLFIGVIIDNFNMLKKKYEGGVLEIFLTESQKHYYTAMKKLGRKKPQKVIKRPINQFLALFYDLSNSRRFEIAIFILIFANMLSMGIEHYNQPHSVFFVLEVSNAFFTTVFGLEAIVKMIGLRYHYFTVPWNMFDFWLVLASILGIVMEDIMIDFPVSPTLLRVVRVFRIGRILRLIKAAKGIRKLLFALIVSLPALFNIGALLALITFIYAIIGMSVFGHVRQQGALDDMVNFQTFGNSMQLLFRLLTSAGWNDVLESLMVQPPDCNPSYNNLSNGDCGYPLLSITYFTSFIIISYMIVINMYIAIILENFNQAHQEEEIGIVEDDLEMFYVRWSKYDPHASQFIHLTQLSDFIASLDPPLGIPKPNIVALVSFNLPIARGDRIHCLDILHALVKHVLGHVEETDTFRQLQEQMDIKFKKQFPTRKELEIVSSTRLWKRQDKAARTIQLFFKDIIRQKRDREREAEQEDEMTQTSSPGASGWQSRLSAFLHVHRGSRASSRKSSRASDASDISELGGVWLNIPLLLMSSTAIPNNGQSEEEHMQGKRDSDTMSALSERLDASPKPAHRRKSIYNFFLRHQDAVETEEEADAANTLVVPGSVPQVRKSGTMLSLHSPSGSGADLSRLKHGSLIRRKPPLERTSSGGIKYCAPSFPFLSGARKSSAPAVETSAEGSTDVSILVTEPSPDSKGTPMNERETLVHVLVHRESEEYDVDDKNES